MFCKMFSESSPGRWAVLQLPCCPSQQGELPENMLQNLPMTWWMTLYNHANFHWSSSVLVISNYFAFSGADHDALHRLPRPHILQLLRIPRREGRRATRHPQVRFRQLRRRPLVGSGKSSVDGGISKYPWLITLIWGQDGAAVYQCRPTIGHERTHKIDKRHAPNTLLSYFVEVVLSAN